jgi:hypothetical protein
LRFISKSPEGTFHGFDWTSAELNGSQNRR